MTITCEKYRQLPGSKRCQHFESNGACKLPDVLMCVEWLKVNGKTHASVTSVPTSGPPAAPASTPPTRTLADRTRSAAPAPAPAATRQPANRRAPTGSPIAPDLINALTPERIAHLKRERIEMVIEFDDVGEVLLTPEPTEPDPLDEFERLTYDDALAIASVAVTFPGARLKRVTRQKKARG